MLAFHAFTVWRQINYIVSERENFFFQQIHHSINYTLFLSFAVFSKCKFSFNVFC